MLIPEGIPATLDEALDVLCANTSAEDRAFVESTTEEEALGGWHHSFGMALRNEWRLWHPAESPLARHLAGIGFLHADDMSGAILRSYHRRIRGQPYELEALAEHYRAYWRDRYPGAYAEMEAERAAIATAEPIDGR